MITLYLCYQLHVLFLKIFYPRFGTCEIPPHHGPELDNPCFLHVGPSDAQWIRSFCVHLVVRYHHPVLRKLSLEIREGS